MQLKITEKLYFVQHFLKMVFDIQTQDIFCLMFVVKMFLTVYFSIVLLMSFVSGKNVFNSSLLEIRL